MKNSEYWIGRMKLLEEALSRKGYEYVLNLEKQFDKAGREIEKELALWYRRFADENNMDLAEAKRLLNSRELEEFRWSVEEYIEKGSSLDPQWKKQLENASIRVHVSRLDSIRLQLQQKAEELYGNQLDGLNRVLAGIYTEGYYHSAFEIAKGTGVGHSLMSIDGRRIEKVLSKPWSTDMRTFRDRCWTDKEALVRKVNTDLTQMIMRGEPPDEAIKAIAKDFKVSKSKAGRLVMTESAAFASISQKDCYDDLEVEKYRIVETLDNSTCELCADLDSKVYKMSEYQVGLTAPPFHPWCRGYTAPAFDDWEELGITPTRAARDPKTGKTVQVEDMTYREWKEKFVTESLKSKGMGATITTKNNINITTASGHAVERALERGVSVESIETALKSPLHIGQIKYDSMGRPSQRFIGGGATVNINPETGTVATVWKTGSSTKKKYGKDVD